MDVHFHSRPCWENRERRRAEILAAVDLAEASFDRGEGRRVTTREQASQLANEIKQRGYVLHGRRDIEAFLFRLIRAVFSLEPETVQHPRGSLLFIQRLKLRTSEDRGTFSMSRTLEEQNTASMKRWKGI